MSPMRYQFNLLTMLMTEYEMGWQ